MRNKYIYVLAGIGLVLLLASDLTNNLVGAQGATDEPGALALLQKQGYKDIWLTGKGTITDCDKAGSKFPTYYRTTFTATTRAGTTVTGVVCKTSYWRREVPERVVILNERKTPPGGEPQPSPLKPPAPKPVIAPAQPAP